MEPPVCVIDNGTGYTKMGYAGNLEPQYQIPSSIATRITVDNNRSKIRELDTFIGEDAEHKKNTDVTNY